MPAARWAMHLEPAFADLYDGDLAGAKATLDKVEAALRRAPGAGHRSALLLLRIELLLAETKFSEALEILMREQPMISGAFFDALGESIVRLRDEVEPVDGGPDQSCQ